MLEQSQSIAQSRSSVLVPLQWLTGMVLVFTLVAAIIHVPNVLLAGCFAASAAMVASSVGAYFWFAMKDPDALRSESHSIAKYAIDKGLFGDSDAGLSEITVLPGGDPVLTLTRSRGHEHLIEDRIGEASR